MTISAELQARYSTECDIDWRHAFVLSHSKAPTAYLIDHTELFDGLVDGVLQTFIPVPTSFVPPSLDDSGTQEAQIVWCGIGAEAKMFLDLAATDPMEPVVCRQTIYILGNPQPQNDPFTEFALAAVTFTRVGVAVTASRSDIFNRQFPTEAYRLSRFPGLLRQ
jgi:hypothetical protein